MAILKMLEFYDETNEIIVVRLPESPSDTLVLGTPLLVQESQVACFFRDGQALDVFQPGRHSLSTQNIPLLGRLIGATFGGRSPFSAYVYFISTKTFTNLGWGTPTPVVFRDTDFRAIALRAHGSYAIRITKPQLFLNTLVGTRGIETTHGLQEYLRTMIVARLNQVLGARMKSILDLPVMYTAIAEDIKNSVKADFAQYGMDLVDLLVEAITPPPEVQEKINQAGGYAIQDIAKYQAIAQADALRDAVKNPGTMGDTMNAGLGLAMGINMANMMAGQFVQPQPGAAAAAPKLTTGELRIKLQELKQLKDDGLITDADFDSQKQRLLQQL